MKILRDIQDFSILPGDGGLQFLCDKAYPEWYTKPKPWCRWQQRFWTITAKKQKLSLHLSKERKKVLSPSSQFNTTVSDVEVEKSFKGYVPKNISCSTCWAVCVFNQWIEQQNKCMNTTYPLDLLEKEYNPSVISECLQQFLSEAIRADGINYPLKTIYQMLCDLLTIQERISLIQLTFYIEKTADTRSYTQLVMWYSDHYTTKVLESTKEQLQ